MAPCAAASKVNDGGQQPPPFTIRAKVKSRTAKSPFPRHLPGTSLVCEGGNRYLASSRIRDRTPEQANHACCSRHRSHCFGSLCLAADCVRDPVLADRLQCREHAQPVRGGGGGGPVPDQRTCAGGDPLVHA